MKKEKEMEFWCINFIIYYYMMLIVIQLNESSISVWGDMYCNVAFDPILFNGIVIDIV